MEVKKRDRKDYKCRVSFAILSSFCRAEERAFYSRVPVVTVISVTESFLGTRAPLQRPSLNRSTVKEDDSA